MNSCCHFILDPEPPSFAFTEDEEETLVWFTGDSNKSIICRGQGKPSPVVRWSDVVPVTISDLLAYAK